MARHTLNGFVVKDSAQEYYDYFGVAAFSPAKLREALEADKDGEVIFEINSPGGVVSAGQEMYSILRSSAANTVAEVQSVAASAASMFICGCKRVMVSPVAQIMIHPPMVETGGDAGDMDEAAQMLRSIEESALNAYETKCAGKTSREELRRMLEASTWLDAARAVEIGLADGILYQENGEETSREVYNAVGGGIRSIFGFGVMPTETELKARYEAEKKAKTPALADDWRNAARLELAKSRIR